MQSELPSHKENCMEQILYFLARVYYKFIFGLRVLSQTKCLSVCWSYEDSKRKRVGSCYMTIKENLKNCSCKNLNLNICNVAKNPFPARKGK